MLHCLLEDAATGRGGSRFNISACFAVLLLFLASCPQWKAKEAKRQRDMGMLCCYWEGLVAAHLRAGRTDWWVGGCCWLGGAPSGAPGLGCHWCAA